MQAYVYHIRWLPQDDEEATERGESVASTEELEPGQRRGRSRRPTRETTAQRCRQNKYMDGWGSMPKAPSWWCHSNAMAPWPPRPPVLPLRLGRLTPFYEAPIDTALPYASQQDPPPRHTSHGGVAKACNEDAHIHVMFMCCVLAQQLGGTTKKGRPRTARGGALTTRAAFS